MSEYLLDFNFINDDSLESVVSRVAPNAIGKETVLLASDGSKSYSKLAQSILDIIYQKGKATIKDIAAGSMYSHQRISDACSVMEHLGILIKEKKSRNVYFLANKKGLTGENYDVTQAQEEMKRLQALKKSKKEIYDYLLRIYSNEKGSNSESE